MKCNLFYINILLLCLLRQAQSEGSYRQAICNENIYTSRREGETQHNINGVNTILDLFFNVCESDSTKNYLGTIKNDKVHYMSYGDVYTKSVKIASFLKEHTGEKDIIGIYSINRAECVLSEYATYMSNCKICPLNVMSKTNELKHILNETEMKICFASDIAAVSLVENVLCNSKTVFIKKMIIFGSFDETIEEKYKKLDIEVSFLNEIIEKEVDKEKMKEWVYPRKDDIAVICYTSGTTGSQKGVELTHNNFISSLKGFHEGFENGYVFKITSSDVYISFLPLAHVMERLIFLVLMSKQAAIAFYRGNKDKITEDCKVIQPTFIAAVPKIYDSIKERTEEEISKRNKVIRKLIKHAIKQKIKNQKHGIYSSAIYDALFFNRIRSMFGGKLKAALSGSAALNPGTCNFVQAILSIPIYQGYGQTESTGSSFVIPLGCTVTGSIGIPLPCNQAKIRNIEILNGVQRSELLLKGENICKGYFKHPEATKELFDDEGWLKTGDVVEIHDGLFKVVSRLKDNFKTSRGEYVMPERIEDALKIPEIEDIYVTGKCSHECTVALVVCKNPEMDEAKLLKLFNEVYQREKMNNEEKRLYSYEVPKRVKILTEDFNEECFTMKKSKIRGKFEEVYKKEIDEMLSESVV